MSIIPHKQLTLADIYDDCQEVFENDKPAFLTLLANHINLEDYGYNSSFIQSHRFMLPIYKNEQISKCAYLVNIIPIMCHKSAANLPQKQSKITLHNCSMVFFSIDIKHSL